MTEFTAGNGVNVLWKIDPDLAGPHAGPLVVRISEREAAALREFFQHERDEELGRWRWPENRDYVVYLRNDGQACVFNEATGVTVYRFRGEHEHLEELRRQSGEEVMPHTHAARAYFEAHPERKPWEDAQPGEVWVLTFDGAEDTFKAYESRLGKIYFTRSRETSTDLVDERITAGRRIWPEDAS